MTTKEEMRSLFVAGVEALPGHMVGGLNRYLERGVRPGDFLFLLLQGKTDEAFMRADSINSARRGDWEKFMADHMPEKAHGSVLKVEAWIEMDGLYGYPDGKP